MPLIDLNGLGHFKDKENAMIAEDFSASKAYAAGDYCYYNGTLYKFKTAHAAGAWTIADVEAAKLAHDVSDLKTAINIMNDGGKIDFYHGDAAFYNGYYNETPEYTGNGSIASPPFTGWNVLLVHVIAGKTIKISGMPTDSGALSVWLNSSSLTDIKETAWNSSLNNGTKTCKSDWLALSGKEIDPSTVSIVYEERKDLQDQIDENAERVEGFVDDITESLAYSDVMNAVTGLNLVGCSCVTAKQSNTWIATTVLSGLTLTSGRKYKILCRADGIMDVSGYVRLHNSDESVLQNSPTFSGKSSVSFTYKASSNISGAYIAVSYGSTTPHTFMTYFYEFAEGTNEKISEVVYDSTSLRNGSILNGSNANFVALPVVLTQASKIRVLTNRPNSENCVYEYQYYTATAVHEDLKGTSDYTGFAQYRNNVYSITNSVPRVGVQVAIAEYNTTTGEMSALRVSDFAGYLIYIADISAEETSLIGDVPYYYDDYMVSRIGTIRGKDLAIGNTGESFIFITDIHERTKYYSPLLAEYIIKNTSVDRLIYGGDYINQPSSKDSAVSLLYRFVGVGRVIDETVFMRGNHETNPYGTGQLTSGEVYQILNSHIEKYTDTDQKNYYVIDNESQKIRELFIDTGEDGAVDSDQLAWITTRVQELGSDWTIIVFSHLGIYASGKDVRSPISFYPVMDDVLPILRNATATVACWVCGHVHKDLIYTEETFPIIAVTCDANGVQASNASSDARESGTINEHAFDVFHVDTNTKTIYATRIGGGQYDVTTTGDYTDNDRQWTYT